MTGNGYHRTYKNGDLEDGSWHCFDHIANDWTKPNVLNDPPVDWPTIMESQFLAHLMLKMML